MIWLTVWFGVITALLISRVIIKWDTERLWKRYNRGYYDGGRMLIKIMEEDDIVSKEQAVQLYDAIIKNKDRIIHDSVHGLD